MKAKEKNVKMYKNVGSKKGQKGQKLPTKRKVFCITCIREKYCFEGQNLPLLPLFGQALQNPTIHRFVSYNCIIQIDPTKIIT